MTTEFAPAAGSSAPRPEHPGSRKLYFDTTAAAEAIGLGGKPAPERMQPLEWRPIERGPLIGRAEVRLPIGLEVSELGIQGRPPGAQLPSEIVHDAPGQPLKGGAGKAELIEVEQGALRWGRITTSLNAALGLASDGLAVFPCQEDKRPACPHGFKDAERDPNALRDLWHRYPGPLVGVATGEPSGINVLDIDAPRHPEAAEWWERHHDRLPATRTHQTRSGGLHVLFRYKAGMRCWTGRPVPGIDGRADGGYVIWWPAIGLLVLSDAKLAPWPAWLFPELRRPRSLVDRRTTVPDGHALAGLVRKVAGASEGERNALAFWAACRAGEMAASGLLGEETAAAVMSMPPCYRA